MITYHARTRTFSFKVRNRLIPWRKVVYEGRDAARLCEFAADSGDISRDDMLRLCKEAALLPGLLQGVLSYGRH